ncbi:MAG: hypothetical protein GXP24_11085, partial [Planctomycetes bacterium]|nr:hypothetical protein [Planctomycetota bacterium]
FRGIRDELLDVLARKQRRERQLHEDVKQDETEAIRLQADLERTTDDLNEKVAERERLEEIVAGKLKAHGNFQQLSKQALIAEQELQRNEERIAEIKQEASEKLPAYENNRMFRYLYDRGFGTPEYKKKGLTRTLDRWVAKFVKFNRSRRGYDFLRVTPELMAAEVLRRREQFNVLMEQIEAIDDEISDEIGLTEVLRKGQELGTQRDNLVAELAQLEQKFTQHQQELLSLEGTQNEFYEQGVGQMKSFLAEMEHSWLEQQSRSTPERQDDELVAEIGWVNKQLDDAQRQSSKLMQEQRDWDERSQGLQDVVQRFRRADFDSRRSFFSDDFDVERLLSDYLRGETGREEMWSVLRRYQQFRQTRYNQGGWDQRGRSVDDSWGMDNLGGVLGRVLIEVAGEAMKHAVRRGMQRRGPFRSQSRQRSGRPDFGGGWFTQGRGF